MMKKLAKKPKIDDKRISKKAKDFGELTIKSPKEVQ